MIVSEAITDKDVADARALVAEHGASISPEDFDPQGFERELAEFPGEYAPPAGCLLVARDGDGAAAGCVALRKIGEGVCEMKRMYVRPQFRGRGLGRRLAVEIVARAGSLGCEKMKLDTLPTMRAAHALYRSLGFREIEPYRFNPVPGVVFMELDLAQET
ncbi:MAG: GNAT family N-acetyltransferase [Pyrinomonadaceae bacterium]